MVDGSKQLDWVPENQKAKSEAEKIYATLRECRDQAGLKKMRGIKVKLQVCKLFIPQMVF